MLTLCATLLGFWAFAQDNTGGGTASVDVSTSKVSSTTSSGWYASPWVWVVGAAVLILILVALLNNNRGGGNGTTVTRSTTTTVD